MILDALKVPAVIIELYSRSIVSAASGVEPDVTLSILVIVCCLSPGFILSGLYPTKKSSLNLRLLTLSRTGTHSSSVTPGYTVLSYITISPGFKTEPTVSLAFINGVRTGLLFLSVGVGTVIINTLQF